MSESHREKQPGFATKAIHSGQDYKQWTNLEIVPPIVTSTTFYEADPLQRTGFYYTRVGNPTRTCLEQCLAALDDAKYCLTLPSGSAATACVLHLIKPGDHIIAGLELYGGTQTLMKHHANYVGIEVDFVDSTDVLSVKNAIKPNTKLIWIETPSNPCLKVSDLSAISEVVHSYKNQKILVAVDNTVLTSYFQKSLKLGVDIIMYSLTKYMNGHNDVLMGALCVNDEQLYKKLDYIQVKYGFIPSAFDCYLVNRGVKTLSLRMDRYSENGLAIAKYLETHPNVVKVHHPGLMSHPGYELHKKQCSGYAGLIAVQLKGTINDAKQFLLNLKLCAASGSFGNTRSSAMIPARSSHINVPVDVRNKLEIFDTTVRISVGLENVNDLINDFEQAFKSTYG